MTILVINCKFVKVQSHLGGLSTTVSELEQQQKQRSELQDWIRRQQVAVADWSSRPSKLRPEAAKQELVAMNDLLNTIGDKRSQLMTEMTGSCKCLLIRKLYTFMNKYYCVTKSSNFTYFSRDIS